MTLAVQIEALLFASDQPLPLGRLQEMLTHVTREEIEAALAELDGAYAVDARAFRLMKVGGGWQLATKPEMADVVRRLFTTKRRVRLTKAALESLAIIAYKQPTTRPEIDAIRGVASGGVIETLLERNLIQIAGRSEGVGRPLLYGTTAEFLQYLGLNSLTDLPSLEELERMLSERESAARLADEDELRAMEEAARAGPPPADAEAEPLPAAARLEARLRDMELPTLDELDDELRDRTARVAALSSLVADERRRHTAELEPRPDAAAAGADAASDADSPPPAPMAMESATPHEAPAEAPSATAGAPEECA